MQGFTCFVQMRTLRPGPVPKSQSKSRASPRASPCLPEFLACPGLPLELVSSEDPAQPSPTLASLSHPQQEQLPWMSYLSIVAIFGFVAFFEVGPGPSHGSCG